MSNHAVFASSDIRATRAGHILNFVHTADCDNGTIWAQGDLVGQGVDRESYKCKAAAAGDKVFVIGSVPLLPRARTKSESAETNFYNEAGDVMRAYALEPGDRYEVSTSLVTPASGKVAVGNYITADTSNEGKYVEKAATTAAAAFEAVVRQVKTYGYGAGSDERMIIEVVRNGFYGAPASGVGA